MMSERLCRAEEGRLTTTRCSAFDSAQHIAVTLCGTFPGRSNWIKFGIYSYMLLAAVLHREPAACSARCPN